MPYVMKKMRRSDAAKYRKPVYVPRVNRPITLRSNTTRIKKFRVTLGLETNYGFTISATNDPLTDR